MPTGYTSAMCEGRDISFAEFAMQCARAFGALVTMRDALMDAPIPDKFEPSVYHAKELKKAEQRLADIESWDDARAVNEAASDYEEKVRAREEYFHKNNALYMRYDAMLVKAQAWVPPTADHEELRTFMIEQLEGSIKFDCHAPERPCALSGEEYKQQERLNALWGH